METIFEYIFLMYLYLKNSCNFFALGMHTAYYFAFTASLKIFRLLLTVRNVCYFPFESSSFYIASRFLYNRNFVEYMNGTNFR